MLVSESALSSLLIKDKNTSSWESYIRLYILIMLVNLFSLNNIYGQKNLAKGDKLFNLNLFSEAIPFYIEETKNSNVDIQNEATLKLANCYRLTGQFDLAEEAYKKIFKKKKKDPENLLNYANALKSSAKYAEAKVEFREYAKMKPLDPLGPLYEQSCDSAQKWLDQTIGEEVKNIDVINTNESDFAPIFYDKGIVFSSSRPGGKKPVVSFNGGVDATMLDLYYEPIDKGFENLSPPINLSDINSSFHDGPASFSTDGKVMYFTRTVSGKRAKDKNVVISTLQIFMSRKDSLGNWSEPLNAFYFNSDDYSVAHPSVSADGSKIYFMSDMPGGMGGTDIYVSDLNPDGTAGKPYNIGAPVNTMGNELFPFISYENNKLYFSSNFHVGMGKLDIFSATKINGKWTNITNLKPPINSIADDFAICFDQSGAKGFFSSDRFNGKGSDDIYSFFLNIPLELTIKGGTVQFADNSLFDGIKYKLIDNSTQEEKLLESTNGMYSFTPSENKKYTLAARKEGLLFNKIEFDILRNTDKDYLIVNILSKSKNIKVNGFLLEKRNITDTLSKELPIADVEVSIKDSIAFLKKIISKTNGGFSFGNLVLLPGVGYQIIASKSGMKTNGLECKGTIYNERKDIEKGVTVQLLNANNELIDQQQTKDDGSYSFKIIKNQTYKVIAIKEGYDTVKINIGVNEKISKNTIAKDIYLSPVEKLDIVGTVIDKNKEYPFSEVILMKDKKVIEKINTSNKGAFTFSLLPDQNYTITATSKGYFPKTVEISTIGKTTSDFISTLIELEAIVAERAVEVKNIYYDYNKADVRFESFSELDKLVDFMRINPDVMIELSAHTDNRGNDEYNLKLSQSRAESARNYLILEDVDPSRIIPKGYGETKPIVLIAKTETEHQLNRRTEFKVLTKK